MSQLSCLLIGNVRRLLPLRLYILNRLGSQCDFLLDLLHLIQFLFRWSTINQVIIVVKVTIIAIHEEVVPHIPHFW